MKKIYLEGQSVEVSEEVFVAYMQGDRKMRISILQQTKCVIWSKT
jgi:hypothetical protein